jgi:hypothetical protein
MEKSGFLLLAVSILISSASRGQNETNGSALPKEPTLTPSTFIDHGMWLTTPALSSVLAEPNESPITEEAMFATYSFSDARKTYNVELYYRELYNRLRARVLVGDRELHGLFNRFYSVDKKRRIDVFTVMRNGCPRLNFNFGFLPLKESVLDTDVIYDAVEKFAAKSLPRARRPLIRVSPPPGMLKKTCRASVGASYLVNEEGQIGPFTLKNLLIAYCQEGIRAERREDFERIGRSLVEAHGKSIGLDNSVVSEVSDVRKYGRRLLDLVAGAEIGPPASYKDGESEMDYWTCYACARYKMGPSILARYEFGFQNGLLSSGERAVLGEDASGAYTGYPNLQNLRLTDRVVLEQYREFEFPEPDSGTTRERIPGSETRVSASPSHTLALLRFTFVGAGVFLLALAYVVQRCVRMRSGIPKHSANG